MRYLVTFVMLCLFAAPATAQEAFTVCDMQAAAAEATRDLTVAIDGDDESAFTAARAAYETLAAALVRCSDLAREGVGQKVVQLQIDAGVYNLTLLAPDDPYSIVDFTPLEGECGEGNYMSPNILAGDATAGASVVVLSEGCRVVVSVNANGAWQLVLVPIE